MTKAKFWLVQIALVAIVGLVFGSQALAGGVNNGNASDNGIANASTKAGGEGGVNSRGHLGSHSSGGGKGSNDGGKPQGEETDTGTTGTGTTDPVCSQASSSECTSVTCGSAGGTWGNDGVCYFFG